MTVVMDETQDTYVVHFNGDVNIADAQELKSLLLKILDSRRETHISFEMASALDVPALQLLYAFERDAKRLGIQVLRDGDITSEIAASITAGGFDGLAIASLMSSENSGVVLVNR